MYKDKTCQSARNNVSDFKGRTLSFTYESPTDEESDLQVLSQSKDKLLAVFRRDLLHNINSRKQKTGSSDENGSSFGLLLCEDLTQCHDGQLTWASAVAEGSSYVHTIQELLG